MQKLLAVFASSIITCSLTNEITNHRRGSVRIEEGRIKLPKVGWVKVVKHREIEPKSTIKTVTISKTPSGEYYVSILVEYEKAAVQGDT